MGFKGVSIIQACFRDVFLRDAQDNANDLDPVVQSIFSLTSSLVVKMLTVLVSSISNSQVFLLKKKNVSSKSSHFFFQQKY